MIDLVFGEIPDRAHPTVYMGKIIAWLKPRIRNPNPTKEKANGVLLCIGLVALFAIPVFFLLWAIRTYVLGWVGWTIYIVVAAILLKSTFALRCMRYYTHPVETAMKNKDLDEARQWLHYIVRRNPNQLDERHIISAAVESIAESTTDGVTSPFFFYALFGLPGAFAFRAINTLDSMVGYKDPANTNIGWFSAKMDTIANYIPSRVTAILIVASSALLGGHWRNSWRILMRDKNKTASPNAGWTISAMAGALNTQLEKKGYYALGDGENIAPDDITKAWHIMQVTAASFGFTMVLPILALTTVLLSLL